MHKKHFLIVDTETTIDNLVVDFGAIVCNRQCEIVAQCGVLVRGIFDKPRKHPLFFNDQAGGLWTKANLARRYDAYREKLANGTRMMASVSAINQWLAKAAINYDPALTAYNLAFDVDKCGNTSIDLGYFSKRFCLWQAAYTQWAHTKAYRAFVLGSHAFNAPTEYRNMTYKTNAETMVRFVLGQPELQDEPHTALEDAIDYELPILQALVKRRSMKWLLNEPKPYNWHDCQVRDWFEPKRSRR